MIEMADGTAVEVRLLARAWKVTPGEAIGRLLDEFKSGGASGAPPTALPGRHRSVAVHAVYRGERVEGAYDPQSSTLEITKGPGAKRKFRTPSAAAIAVVSSLNPEVNPNRNGWSFWIITATGKRLQAIRDTER